MTTRFRFAKSTLILLLVLVMVASCIPCVRPASSAYADISMSDQPNEGEPRSCCAV